MLFVVRETTVKGAAHSQRGIRTVARMSSPRFKYLNQNGPNVAMSTSSACSWVSMQLDLM